VHLYSLAMSTCSTKRCKFAITLHHALNDYNALNEHNVSKKQLNLYNHRVYSCTANLHLSQATNSFGNTETSLKKHQFPKQVTYFIFIHHFVQQPMVDIQSQYSHQQQFYIWHNLCSFTVPQSAHKNVNMPPVQCVWRHNTVLQCT